MKKDLQAPSCSKDFCCRLSGDYDGLAQPLTLNRKWQNFTHTRSILHRSACVEGMEELGQLQRYQLEPGHQARVVLRKLFGSCHEDLSKALAQYTVDLFARTWFQLRGTDMSFREPIITSQAPKKLTCLKSWMRWTSKWSLLHSTAALTEGLP